MRTPDRASLQGRERFIVRFRLGNFLLCEFCVTRHFARLFTSGGVDIEPLEEVLRSAIIAVARRS